MKTLRKSAFGSSKNHPGKYSPFTNTPVIAEQRKSLPGLIAPDPLTRQQKRHLSHMRAKAERAEALEAQKLAGANRPQRKEPQPSTRAERRRKHEE